MNSLTKYLIAGAFLAPSMIAIAPAGATAIPATIQSSADLPPEAKAEFDSWPPDKQAAYEVWPPETQAYYWELSASRQALFWRLSDQDKIALTAMTGDEREAAWNQIEGGQAQPPG